jgi:hypothetical protein
MSPFRKVIYYFTSLLFYIVLLITPLLFAITVVFGSAGNVTGALKESGVYDRYVDLVLDSSAQNNTDEQTKQLLENQDIRNIAKESFTPELLERSSNDFVQSIYDWLEGKTPEPQFTIDLTTAKTTLTEKLSAYAETRAASLPTCTLEQLQSIDTNSDLLNLPCLPPGLTAQQVGERFSQQLLANSDFLEQPIITNQTLTEQNNGRPITANAQDVPERYQQIQDFKWLLVAIAIILGLLLILARRDRQAGVKHVAWALVLSAAFLAVALLSYWYVFDKVTSANTQGSEVQTMVFDGATVLLTDINQVIAWFAASYAVIGLATLLLLRRKGEGHEPGSANHPPANPPSPKENSTDTKK